MHLSKCCDARYVSPQFGANTIANRTLAALVAAGWADGEQLMRFVTWASACRTICGTWHFLVPPKGQTAILSNRPALKRMDPSGAKDVPFVNAIREVHRRTRHLEEILAFPEIGRQMLGLPDDGTFRQLTIMNNGEVPQCSYP